MNKKLIRKFTICILLILALIITGCSTNQPVATKKEEIKFPTKPITIYNSSKAGSPTDIMAREVARHAEKHLGQPLNVINKTGGSGGVMFAALLAEPADGHFIGSVTASQIAALQAGLDKEFPFDGFEFIANVQVEPYAMAVKVGGPFTKIEDIVDYAKKNPGKLQIGGQGTGSALHLCALKWAKDAEFTFTWLPYSGGSESVKNLLGDHVQVIMTAPATVRQYVEAGQVKIVAITGDKRLPQSPDVPTFKDAGYDIALTQYRGFFAKKGLPPEVKAKLADAIRKATQEQGFVEYMTKNDMPDAYMGPEEFTKYARTDYEAIGTLAKELLPEQKK